MTLFFIYKLGDSYFGRYRLDDGDHESTARLIPKDAVLVRRYTLGKSSVLELEGFVERLNRRELEEKDLPEVMR